MEKFCFAILFFIIIFVSGCIDGVDITRLVKTSEEGKEFLNEYPNAEITAVLLSEESISSIIDDIREDCGSYIPINSYWKITFYDPDTETEMVSWAEADTRKILCFIKRGGRDTTTTTLETTTTTTVPETTTTSSTTTPTSSTTTPTSSTTTTTTTLPSVCGDGDCGSSEYYCPDDCGWFWAHRENTTSISYNGIYYNITANGTCGISGSVDLNFSFYDTSEEFSAIELTTFSLNDGLTLRVNGMPCSADVINIGVISDQICIDSDNGRDYFVKGTCRDDRETDFTDACEDEGGPNERLVEYECGMFHGDITCIVTSWSCEDLAGPGYVCSNGECVHSSSTTTTTTTTTTLPSVCGDGDCGSSEYYCPDDCGWFWAHMANTTSISYKGVNYDVNADGGCGPSGKVDFNFSYDDTTDSIMGIGQGDTFYLSNELVLKLNGLPCSVDVINIGLICGDGECESYEHYCPEDCGWFWVHRENTTSIFYNGVNYDVTADGTCGISGEVDLNFTYDTTIDSFTGLSQEDIFSLSNDLGLILNSLPCMSDVINIGIQ